MYGLNDTNVDRTDSKSHCYGKLQNIKDLNVSPMPLEPMVNYQILIMLL